MLKILISAVLLAATVIAGENPRPQIRSVRFVSKQLSVSKKGASAYIRGPVRVDMSFPDGPVKRPVLRIVCLCDVDGELVCYSGLWAKPKTSSMMGRGEIGSAFKQAGLELKGADRKTAFSDIVKISCCQGECSKETFSSVVYGEKDLYRGFFRAGSVKESVRILVYRLELWQNGALAGAYDSPRSAAAGYQLPEDWHVVGKYGDKFRYDVNP